MKTSPTRYSSIKLPVKTITLSTFPIFIIALFIPAYPTTSALTKVSNFIDNYLLGAVGAWSSQFPVPSKLIANYISIGGPIIGMLILISAIKNSTLANINLKEITWPKYCLMAFGLALVDLLFIYKNYFSAADIAEHDHKLSLFGNSLLLFPFFSSTLILALYGLILFNYLIFYLIPQALSQQAKLRRRT